MFKPSLAELTNIDYHSHPRLNGCVVYWLGSDGGGNALYDIINNHDGSFTGVAVDDWITTPFGYGLTVDSNSNDISNGSVPRFTGEVTVSMWVKPKAIDNALAYFISHGTSGSLMDFAISMNEVFADNFAVFWWAGVSATFTTGTTALSSTEYYHLVGVRRGSSGSWTGEIWVNGELETSVSSISSNPDSGTPPTLMMNDKPDRGHHGAVLDFIELRVYNRALSPESIASLYHQPYLEFLPARTPPSTFIIPTGTIPIFNVLFTQMSRR